VSTDNIVQACDKGLFTALNVSAVTSLATGGVHNWIAPEETAPPFVVFNFVDNVDSSRSFSPTEKYHTVRYLVKAVTDDGWPKPGQDIQSQIINLLDRATLSIENHTFLYCEKVRDVIFSEHVGRERWFHVGAFYDIWADEP